MTFTFENKDPDPFSYLLHNMKKVVDAKYFESLSPFFRGNLPARAFITVSNHPYGGLDGIMLIDLMARIRSLRLPLIC